MCWLLRMLCRFMLCDLCASRLDVTNVLFRNCLCAYVALLCQFGESECGRV